MPHLHRRSLIPLLRYRALVLSLGTILLAGCDRERDPRGLVQPSQVLAQSIAQSGGRMTGVSDEIRATHPWRLALLMKNFAWSSPYWRRVHEGAQTASEDFGVYLRVLGVEQYDVEAQIRQLDHLIDEGRTDGIILAPVDTNQLPPVVEKAIAAGIPVIAYDTPLNADHILTSVGFDDFGAGRLLGRWVSEQLHGTGNVMIVEGPPGNQNALDRRNGMIAGLSEGDINVLGLQSGNWHRDEARVITETWLARFDDIDAILAADDVMAFGVIDAIEAAGRRGIVVTGFDANADALLAIRQGRLHATVQQVPRRQARRAVQLMVRHLETGELLPASVLWRDIRLITAENVVEYQR